MERERFSPERERAIPAKRQMRERAAIRVQNGIPGLWIGNKPLGVMAYFTYNPSNPFFGQFTRFGVHLYFLASTCTSHLYGLAPDAWVSSKKFDFSFLKESAEKILGEDPQAFLIPHVFLGSPSWWNERHPSQLVVYEDRDGKRGILVDVEHNRKEKKPVPSWASKVWRRDTEKALTRYIDFLEQSSFGKRVVGLHLTSGITEEWMQWGSNGSFFTDFSEANAEGFRDWLKKKYRTADALQRAWREPGADFSNASIPSVSERLHSWGLVLRDPNREQKVIDFYRYNSALVAETILYFARVVKEASRGRLLCGAYYGYVLQLCDWKRQQESGHMALGKLLRSPLIDFLSSPNLYNFRGILKGIHCYMVPLASCRLNGKLWIDQYDYRTFLTPWPPGTDPENPVVTDMLGYTASRRDTLRQMRREFAHALCNGSLLQWFDMDGGWFADEKLMEEISWQRGILERAWAFPRDSVAQVAVLVDAESMLYTRLGDPLTFRLVIKELPELLRMGTPFDLYEASDLPKISPSYRLWIFLNLLAPSGEILDAIEKRVKRRGNTLLWLYGPGVLQKEGIGEEGVSRLLGMRIRMIWEERPLEVVLLKERHPLLQGISGKSYGRQVRSIYFQHLAQSGIGPVFCPEAGEGKVLGIVKGLDLPGFVYKEEKGMATFFSAAPFLPSRLFRNISRWAGVPVYVEKEDLLYMNRSFLSLIPVSSGIRRIRFPHPHALFNLLEGRSLGGGKKRFLVRVKRGDPLVFFLGTKKEWEHGGAEPH